MEKQFVVVVSKAIIPEKLRKKLTAGGFIFERKGPCLEVPNYFNHVYSRYV